MKLKLNNSAKNVYFFSRRRYSDRLKVVILILSTVNVYFNLLSNITVNT